jgi:hypothetical protein
MSELDSTCTAPPHQPLVDEVEPAFFNQRIHFIEELRGDEVEPRTGLRGGGGDEVHVLAVAVQVGFVKAISFEKP